MSVGCASKGGQGLIPILNTPTPPSLEWIDIHGGLACINYRDFNKLMSYVESNAIIIKKYEKAIEINNN